MLQSMTGFGKASGSFLGKKVSIEVRALNSKVLDLNVRTPNLYRELESLIRKLVSDELERGKIDVSVILDETGDAKSITVNKALVKAYYEDMKAANELIGEKTEDYLALIMRLPEVLTNEKTELSQEEKDWLMSLTKEACDKLNEFRNQEGDSLVADFTANIEAIRTLLDETAEFEGERVAIVRQRMEKQLEDIRTGNYDANRLEQELIYYLEKYDVSEERTRMTNHLDYFIETMKIPSSGRKLGFISQEIGREINTLGSKCNQADMQKKVVDMKDHLEKIKEQVLNTL